MIYVILCWLLFINESLLESYVIALKKVQDLEKPEEFEKLNKAEHSLSALFSLLIVMVVCLAMSHHWFLMISLVPARRVFFDFPLPLFRNRLQDFKLPIWKYNPDPKGVDALMAGLFGKNNRWLEFLTEVTFIVAMILIEYFTNGRVLNWFV